MLKLYRTPPYISKTLDKISYRETMDEFKKFEFKSFDGSVQINTVANE